MSLLLNNKRKKIISTSSDPYFNNVVLYLKGDGTNGSTSIIDSSNSAKSIFLFGDTQISTAQSKYGGSSIIFDGSGDYLQLSANDTDFTDISNSSTDYTIELWSYITSSTVNRGFFDTRLGGSGGWEFRMNGTTRTVTFYYTGSTSITSMGTLTLNTWNHVALTKSSSVFRIWINGVGDSSNTFGLRNFTTTPRIGGSTNPYIGHIDSFRVTKGVARYTANFNPETDTYLNV